MKGLFLGLLCFKFLCPFQRFRGMLSYIGVVEVGLNRNNRNQELSGSCTEKRRSMKEGVRLKTAKFTQILLQSRS